MTDNRKSGIALVAGSVGAIVTMAVHPHGINLPAAQVDHLALAAALAHSLALVSVLAMVLGACGLTLRLHAPDRLAFTAMVVFAFAAVAIMIAAAVSGFIVPGIMRHMVRDSTDAAPTWRITILSIFEINQAFASIYSVSTGIAIALWSAAALRQRRLGPGLAIYGVAIYGCITAPLVAIALGSGLLHLDVPGMAIMVVAQGIWFIIVGSELYHERETLV